MSDRTSNVAIYWDFENIQASLVEKKGGPGGYGRTKFQPQEALLDVDSVMEYAATFGVVSINRAYCNWQWYGKYREALLRNGLELIQLFPPGASAKNGGDIKLALDCTEDLLRFPHLDIVVIVGGDSDYLPLAQKVKAMGKNLVGIGTQANTNRHWARSCHEFKFYEALILDDEPRDLAHAAAPAVTNPVENAGSATATAQGQAPVHEDRVVQSAPEELLRRAIRRLSGKSGDAWVLKGSIRPMLKRLDPTFEEEQHGVRSFSAFIRKFEHLLEVRAGRNDQELRLRAPGEALPERPREERHERGERHREDRDRGERGERGERRDRERGERRERRERFVGPERPLDMLVKPGEEKAAETPFGIEFLPPQGETPPEEIPSYFLDLEADHPSAPAAPGLADQPTEPLPGSEFAQPATPPPSGEIPAPPAKPEEAAPAEEPAPKAKGRAPRKPAKPKADGEAKPAAKPRSRPKPKKEG